MNKETEIFTRENKVLNKETEILTKAKELIEKGWTKEYYARDKHENKVDTLDASACYFCSFGAYYRVCHDLGFGISGVAHNYFDIAIKEIKGESMSIVDFNDSRFTTKEDVLKMYDRVIELSKTSIIDDGRIKQNG